MHASAILNTIAKRFSVYALAAAGVGILLASCQRVETQTAQTTWTITIDVKGGSIKYGLDYEPKSGGCPYATPSADPTKTLHVCTKDLIKWKADSSAKKSEMVVFVSDGILASVAPASFPASDDQDTNTGQITATPDGIFTAPHEWYVAVYDKNTNHPIYHDDPKIIIGR